MPNHYDHDQRWHDLPLHLASHCGCGKELTRKQQMAGERLCNDCADGTMFGGDQRAMDKRKKERGSDAV